MSKNNEDIPSKDDLITTHYINHDDPSIISLSKEILRSSEEKSLTEKSILLHDYVRDEIIFGWNGRFWNETASEVLKSGRGYCITKTCLFASLLRTINIPCRIEFVDINTEILQGLINPRLDYELHTYLNIFNRDYNQWYQLDSYIVDQQLIINAQKKLNEQNLIIGYGIHRHGQFQWNGKENCFIQYLIDSPFNNQLIQPLSQHSYGYYQDIGHFYQSTNQHGVQNRFNNNRLLKLLFPLIIIPSNRAAQQLRQNSF